MSLAWQGGLLTTGSPGKSCIEFTMVSASAEEEKKRVPVEVNMIKADVFNLGSRDILACRLEMFED